MPKERKIYAEIALPLAAPGTYTFGIPSSLVVEIAFGKRVTVQFGRGKKIYTGLVMSISEVPPDITTKDILDIVDATPVITLNTLQFWKWMAGYYMCTIGEVMEAALPGILNLSSESRFMLNRSIEIEIEGLEEEEISVVNALESKSEMTVGEFSKLLSLENPMPVLSKLIERSIIISRQEIGEKFKPKTLPYIALSSKVDSENIDEIVLSLSRAQAQLKALMTLIDLSEWDGEEIERQKIKKSLLVSSGVTDATIRALVQKEIFTLSNEVESRLDLTEDSSASGLKSLNEEQIKCLEEIKNIFLEKEVVLLHGVTSSGKTEIYAHFIKEQLDKGKQILFLLPEIALTNQLIARFQIQFGNKVTVYHSRLNQNERVEVWKLACAGEESGGRLFLGARSAVFLPFSDLGLVVADEEHDRSFKQQDPAPRYQARDAAIVLANLYKSKVILGSATPSLESYENALSGKYGLTTLKKRYGGFQMPEILAVDLTEERRKRRMKASFSQTLYNQIKETTDAGEQVILFQNRRGYSPFLICNECAHSPKCKNCDVSLTLHKKNGYLLCHYCGYSVKFNPTCPDCKKGTLGEMGLGTERIEEELKELFPNLKLARFDLDSTRKKHAFKEILDQFEQKEIDVLVGTQMVTKGLDFENVGLVGIINADTMLRFPDFRSFERTFQTLTQVSGRAGRKKHRGKVVIQSFDPFHPVIQKVLSTDYLGFLEAEMKERHQFRYPPFLRLLNIHLKHHDRQTVFDAARAMGEMLKRDFKSNLLGPEFPYIERIRNQYAMEFIMKIEKGNAGATKKILAKALAEFLSKSNFKSVKVYLDVDPY